MIPFWIKKGLVLPWKLWDQNHGVSHDFDVTRKKFGGISLGHAFLQITLIIKVIQANTLYCTPITRVNIEVSMFSIYIPPGTITIHFLYLGFSHRTISQIPIKNQPTDRPDSKSLSEWTLFRNWLPTTLVGHAVYCSSGNFCFSSVCAV